MSGWSDPQKGGRAVGAALYPTLSSLLASTPKPGMRATASDAPGSMLYEVGGKWGGSLGHFASWGDLPAAATLSDGACATCQHILGIETFRVKRAFGLWRVEPGEVVVVGTGPGGNGYDLTASSTTTVQLDTCVIPAGLIKVGETWAVDTHAEKTTHVSGSDTILVRWAGVLALGNNNPIPAAVGAHLGDVNVSWVDPTTCRRRLGGGKNNDSASGNLNFDVPTIDADQNLSMAVAPGGAGNVIKVCHWALRRIA